MSAGRAKLTGRMTDAEWSKFYYPERDRLRALCDETHRKHREAQKAFDDLEWRNRSRDNCGGWGS